MIIALFDASAQLLDNDGLQTAFKHDDRQHWRILLRGPDALSVGQNEPHLPQTSSEHLLALVSMHEQG